MKNLQNIRKSQNIMKLIVDQQSSQIMRMFFILQLIRVKDFFLFYT